MNDERVWLYQGQAIIPGVPGRDLTAEEYEKHKALIEQSFAVTGRRLYIPLAEMDEQTAKLQTLLDDLQVEKRLSFGGKKLTEPMKPEEVMATEDEAEQG